MKVIRGFAAPPAAAAEDEAAADPEELLRVKLDPIPKAIGAGVTEAAGRLPEAPAPDAPAAAAAGLASPFLPMTGLRSITAICRL